MLPTPMGSILSLSLYPKLHVEIVNTLQYLHVVIEFLLQYLQGGV